MSWTVEEIAKAIHGLYQGRDFGVKGFAIHTQFVEEGFVYVALKGAKVDGHLYLNEAKRKGAVAAIVSQHVDCDLPMITVSNTDQALKDLGHYQRARLKDTTIIAVTGSSGKTSTKELLTLLLSCYGKTYGSFKSYNTIYGMPVCLANCPLDAAYGVFELGMSHPGEIREMGQILRPHAVVIVNVGTAHIEFFKNIQDIARAKAEVMENLEPKGLAVIYNDPEVRHVFEQSIKDYLVPKALWFGKDPTGNSVLTHYGGGRSQAAIGTKKISYHMTTLGEHFALNALGALTLIESLGLDLSPALEKIAAFQAVKGRGTITQHPWKGSVLTVVDESYNANPSSVRAALSRLQEIAGKRKYIVLADMKELGDKSPTLHAELASAVLSNGVSGVICYGEMSRYLFDSVPKAMQTYYGNTPQDVKEFLAGFLQAGDVVLFKASLTMGMGTVVGELFEKRKS